MKHIAKFGLKGWLAAVLIAVLLPVQAVFAEEGDALRFADVPDSHWAQKYIARMALKGVVTGYVENGERLFRPDRPVSQQEAGLMALRLMGQEDEALRSDITYILNLETDPFFKPFIDYAVSISLINYQEEIALMGLNQDGVRWGEKAATREWIARLVIRAIGQRTAEESAIRFEDEQDISAWAYGYVNAAANLGIVTGRGGRFAPQDPVTRAEMVTFLSRADAFLEQPDSVFTGRIRSVTGNAFTIQDESGRLLELTVDAGTRLYTHDQFLPIYWFQVEPLQSAYVIHADGRALYLEILDDGLPSETVRGRLAAADPAGGTLRLQAEGEEAPLTYAFNGQAVEIVGPDGAPIRDAAANLIPGSLVELTFVAEPAGERTVTRIRVIDVPVSKEVVNGTIQSLDLAAGIVSLFDHDRGLAEQFPLSPALADGTKIVPYGSRSLTVRDLRSGDKISYKVEDSVVTDITLKEPEEPILTQMRGEVVLNDQDRGELIFVPEGERFSTSRPYAGKVEVVLEGVPAAGLRDIERGDEVLLTLDNLDRIVRVVITNRSIVAEYMVTFLYYDEATNNMVTRIGTRNEIFELTNDTKIYDAAGAEIPHKSIRTALAEGKRLDIVYSKVTNRLLSARVSGTYDGTVEAVDRANSRLTITNSSGHRITFDVRNAFLEIPGRQTTAGLGDFAPGQEVRVVLDGTQSNVSWVQLKQKQLFKIESLNLSTRRAQLVAEDGLKREETIPYSAIIRTASGAGATINNLQEGMDIYVRYVGRSITEISIAQVSWGRVTAVDEAAGTFTILDANSRNATKRFDNPNRVPVSVGDRVYVITNPEGHQSVTVMTVLERKWRKFDPETRQVSFYKKTVSEQSVFTVHANAAAYRGSSPIPVESLADGDEVTAYLYNGLVMEIVKK